MHFGNSYDPLTKETHKKMNLSTWSRFRRRVVVWVQVLVHGVRILCRVRISGLLGRISPDLRHQVRFLNLGLDFTIVGSWHISEPRFGIYTKLGVYMIFGGSSGLPCANLRLVFNIFGSRYGWFDRRLAPKALNEPQVNTRQSKRSTNNHPDPKFCVDSESELKNVLAPRNHEQ